MDALFVLCARDRGGHFQLDSVAILLSRCAGNWLHAETVPVLSRARLITQGHSSFRKFSLFFPLEICLGKKNGAQVAQNWRALCDNSVKTALFQVVPGIDHLILYQFTHDMAQIQGVNCTLERNLLEQTFQNMEGSKTKKATLGTMLRVASTIPRSRLYTLKGTYPLQGISQAHKYFQLSFYPNSQAMLLMVFTARDTILRTSLACSPVRVKSSSSSALLNSASSNAS